MYIKSIKAAIILILIYNLLFWIFPFNKNYYQDSQQRNRVDAEKFFYSKEKSFDAVIVGSSMGARLIKDSLPDNWYNLSLDAKSSLTGLEMIKKRGLPVRMILIDLNILEDGPDYKMVNTLTQQPMYSIKKIFPSQREANQPMSYAGNLIMKVRSVFLSHEVKKAGVPVSNNKRPAPSSKYLEEMRRRYSLVPDTSLIRSNIALFNEYITYFRERNTKIVLFNMPLLPELLSSVKMKIQQDLLSRYLKTDSCILLPPDTIHQYQPGDGEHLSGEDAAVYSQYLRETVEKAIK